MNSVVNDMVITMSVGFYGFINSDILLHPDFFNFLPVVHYKIERVMLQQISLMSSVLASNTIYTLKSFSLLLILNRH